VGQSSLYNMSPIHKINLESRELYNHIQSWFRACVSDSASIGFGRGTVTFECLKADTGSVNGKQVQGGTSPMYAIFEISPSVLSWPVI
jgi:hypothetical protein